MHIRGLRWWIVSLVFLATLISYIDRLTISVLAPVICTDLHLSNLAYASINTWFLLIYALGQTFLWQVSRLDRNPAGVCHCHGDLVSGGNSPRQSARLV
ncbi:MAG: hypothetical protein ACRD11_13655 [Terriglobia bacterium]